MTRREALEALLDSVGVLPPEQVPLERSMGRIAGESLIASAPIPPDYRSRVDGYALRSADIAGATHPSPVYLPITLTVYPGDRPEGLPPGAAAIVFTGSPLPSGADACVPLEKAKLRDNVVRINTPLAPGEWVSTPGSEVPEGTRLIVDGKRITPYQVGFASSLGRSSIQCYTRPRIALIATGNEIGSPLEGKIAPSSVYTLHAALWGLGALPSIEDIVGDSPESLGSALRSVEADACVTTGGTGPGSRDVIWKTMKALGAECLFKGVSMKPGRHTSAYLVGKRPVLALSGPPVAAFAGFCALVRPMALRMMGCVIEPLIKARLHGEVAASGYERLIPVAIHGACPWAKPVASGECPEALLLIPPEVRGSHGDCFDLIPG